MMKLRKPGPAWASDIYVGLDQARDKNQLFATAVRIVDWSASVSLALFGSRVALIASETLALQSEVKAFRSLRQKKGVSVL